MLDLLLDPRILTAVLVAAAVATPLAALAAARVRPEWRSRQLSLICASGPIALVLWGVHNGVLALLGFDSAWSLLVMVALGIALGVAGGLWLRGAAPATTEES